MATTIVLNDPNPVYGQHISFTYTTDAGRTGCKVTLVHAAGSSQSSVEYHTEPGTYEKEVGLYAPNWPPSGAKGVADVIQITRTSKSGRMRTAIIASLAFEVAAA